MMEECKALVKQTWVKLSGLSGKIWLWRGKFKSYFCVDSMQTTENKKKRTVELKSRKILFCKHKNKTPSCNDMKYLLIHVERTLAGLTSMGRALPNPYPFKSEFGSQFFLSCSGITGDVSTVTPVLAPRLQTR